MSWTGGPRVIKLKKWGNGRENQGPSGYKLKPARVLARALAEMARAHRARKR